MSAFFSKLHSFALSCVRAAALLFTGLLFLSAFFRTCYSPDMTGQKVLTRGDNLLCSILFPALVLCLGYLIQRFVCKVPDKRLPILYFLVLIWCSVLGALLILFGKTVPAADSLSVYSIAESLALGDTSVIHPTESYLSYYPQQVGLTAFFELLIRLWNLLPTDFPAYHMIKGVYVLLALVSIRFQYRTLQLLCKKPQVHCAYLLLIGSNLPFIMYTSFVYGEIPSFAALSAGIYYLARFIRFYSPKKNFAGDASSAMIYSRKSVWICGICSLLFLTLSVFLRKNSLIVIIAVVLTVFFQWLRDRRPALLLLAFFTAVSCMFILPVTRSLYEHRAQNALRSGVPAMSYFAMGMQEASRAPGWYNGFNFNTYMQTGMDTEATVTLSREAIRERLDYFHRHPDYTAEFYFAKFLSQWADGTYASRQATLATFGGRRALFESLYTGSLSYYYIEYCNIYQNILYLGAFLFCLGGFCPSRKKEDSLPLYLGLIAAFGGFLFHIIWEANARYIFVYSLLLLPYCAYGITCGTRDIVRRTAAPQPGKKQQRFHRLLFLCTAAAALLCLLFFIMGYFRTVHYPHDRERASDLESLRSQDYNGLLLSMASTNTLQSETLSYFRGVDTLQAFHRFETLADIGDYLRTALGSGQELSFVYIQFDPALIGEQYGFHASLYRLEYQKQLTSLIAAYPETEFEFLLPVYSLEYWQTLTDRRRDEYINTYRNFVNMLGGQPNVRIYFAGFEEWLIANPDNYEAYDACNPSVSSNLLALTFRDDAYCLNPSNMEERFNTLQNLISAEPSVYDCRNVRFVFFGDSVIGNYTDSLSIPGVVAGCSGAEVYNLGHGGTCAAADKTSDHTSLNVIVDAFLAQDLKALAPDSQPVIGLSSYLEDMQKETAAEPLQEQQLCFVINYGLNDYFLGNPISSEDPLATDTYEGSIRRAVSRLQAAYPDCRVFLLTPNFCTYYENGTQPQSPEGGALTDYVAAVRELSAELSVTVIDNYYDLGINAQNQGSYLSDGCHPNEAGRFLMGRKILETFDAH